VMVGLSCNMDAFHMPNNDPPHLSSYTLLFFGKRLIDFFDFQKSGFGDL
jgi:hypothetical protein